MDIIQENIISDVFDKLKRKYKISKEINRELERFHAEFIKSHESVSFVTAHKKIDKIAKLYAPHEKEVKYMFAVALEKYRTEFRSIDSFSDWMEEQERLDERLIVLNNSAKYNQVLILSGGAACFSEETAVRTKNGIKPIKDVSVGDQVLSLDEATGKKLWSNVKDTKSFNSGDLPSRLMKLITESGQEIICTEDHEFYVDGKWVEARDLENDQFVSKEYLNEDRTVYDLVVEDTHNYCITEDDIIVHNSGKGFALSNFIDSTNYKVRDVDEIKRLVQKISGLGKIDIEELWKTADKSELSQADIKSTSAVLAQNHYKIENLQLKLPEHVRALHTVVSIIGWKGKSLALLNQSIPKNSDHKPNIAFDMTSKSRNSVNKVVEQCREMGYETKNIHLVWVLTNYHIAIDQNKTRDRVVPEDMLLITHKGAAETLTGLVAGEVPHGIDGAIWVILNNKENTLFWKRGDGKLMNTPEFHNDSFNQEITAKVDQAKYDKIYGDGAFLKRNKRTKGKFGKEHAVIKSFARIQVKKPNKQLGDGIQDIKTQLFNWVIKNIPAKATEAFRTAYGVILGKHHGSRI